MRLLRAAGVALVVLAVVALAWVVRVVRQRSLLRAAARTERGPPAGGTADPSAGAPRGGPRRGGMDLTFVVTADTHVGFWQPIALADGRRLPIDAVNEILVSTFNGLPGTPWPAPIGGRIAEPRGVLVAGDLTEDGKPQEWERFQALYGLSGKDGKLRYPVFEGAGNHDLHQGDHVERGIRERHGDTRYAWDWDDVHFVCLGVAPDDDDLAWLRRDLAQVGTNRGVVLYFHYPVDGPYSRGNWFGDGRYPDVLRDVLRGHHVLGIFQGHTHLTGAYRWGGRDAYLIGSIKHAWRSFLVVRITDSRMTVASYNIERAPVGCPGPECEPKGAFWWWHDKPVFGAAGEERRWFAGDASLVGAPPS